MQTITQPSFGRISFHRLEEIPRAVLLDHMRDPRIAKHLPLLTGEWDLATVDGFVAAKAKCWDDDGLGHWAIHYDGEYAGWGGFQKEGRDWDFGLVLHPDHFSKGREIAAASFDWLARETTVNEVTFLLPLSRSPRALMRMGAQPTGIVEHAGVQFTRWAWQVGARQELHCK
ncbi:hypothetical protein [Erythrobacter mangrovi]|uniref:hypothetical protein n=1 Tax=Erythrobacter mangrovi TaxID=2739433 RepID=UPI0018F8BE8B|nr:hypothetical protein [Erythrobacter mangrovi]